MSGGSGTREEPMVLGSPSSPPPPGVLGGAGGTGAGSAMAPSFLLGTSVSSPRTMDSPCAARFGARTDPATPPTSARPPLLKQSSNSGARQVRWSSKLVETMKESEDGGGSVGSRGRAGAGRPFGPPLRSLAAFYTSSLDGGEEEGKENSGLGWDQSAMDSSRHNLSQEEVDPFYTQGSELEPGRDLDNRVVTVFGFPDAAYDLVIAEFSAIGTVLLTQRGEGNWVDLGYASGWQARAALAKHTKLLSGGRLMIGVTPCIHKATVAAFRQALSSLRETGDLDKEMGPVRQMPGWLGSGSVTSTVLASSPAPAATAGKKETAPPPPQPRDRPGMRSLAAAHKHADSPLNKSGRVAEDMNSSILSSTWSYLFGGNA